MSRPRIQIEPHLEYIEIVRRYEASEDGTTKNYWLAIRLLSQPGNPMPVEQVAEILGCSADWIRKIARRYNYLGAAGMDNSARRHGRGRRSSSRQQFFD